MTTNIVPTDDDLEEFMARFADEEGRIHDDSHAGCARAVLERFGWPAGPTRDATDLAREGMELYKPGQPEHIVCAELVRIAESRQPAAAAQADEPVRIHDSGSPDYLDGIECQYSIERGEPWPRSETLAYVFDLKDAQRIAAALNATCVAAQPTAGDDKRAPEVNPASSAHPAIQFTTDTPAAWCDIVRERIRQLWSEGWSHAHDDEHDPGELAAAGAAYALNAADQLNPLSQGDGANIQPVMWPWHSQWWKPTAPRRDLVKAGALILAEIERLDRMAAGTRED